jgi:aspartate kinase
MQDIEVIGNTRVARVTLHSVDDRPGISAELFGQMGSQGFNVELVSSNIVAKGKADISFVVAEEELPAILVLMDSLKKSTNAHNVTHDSNVSLITITGHGLIQKPGIAGKMFKALSDAGINIQMISTALSSITCMISDQAISDAVKCLEKEFDIKPYN